MKRGYFPMQNPFILEKNSPSEAINHNKGNLCKVWSAKELNTSLNYLRLGYFLARKGGPSESESEKIVTIKEMKETVSDSGPVD